MQALIDQVIAESAMTPAESEVARQMAVCNACRYCEGYCAVFPAMERRLDFTRGDVQFLANLCHDCGACLHACQYAPPHEFAVNVPAAMAAVRRTTYEAHAWPAAFGALYRRQGAWVAAALAGGLAVFFLLALALHGTLGGAAAKGGSFYAVFPHGLMVSIFGAASLWIVLAFAIGIVRFWRGLPVQADPVPAGEAVADAASAALTLRYLDGGGEGCHVESDRATHARRRFHHLTFYGFALCFASTTVATIYHYVLQWPAPYPMTSLPVVLGTLGGIGLLVGPVGLMALSGRRHPMQAHKPQKAMDHGFLGLLLMTSFTGLALLFLRDTAAMPALLAVHLGVVLALFATLPYGKFAHAVYRVTALVKDAIEKRQPRRISVGDGG